MNRDEITDEEKSCNTKGMNIIKKPGIKFVIFVKLFFLIVNKINTINIIKNSNNRYGFSLTILSSILLFNVLSIKSSAEKLYSNNKFKKLKYKNKVAM